MSKLSVEQNKRFKRLGKNTVIFLIVGIIYFFFVLFTNWKIPCVFHLITGKYCPGCGFTRMIMAVAHFDFQLAFHSNAYVLFLLPVGLLWGLYRGIAFVKSGKTSFSTVEMVCLVIAAVSAIAFTVMRNLEQFSFLRPLGF